MSSSPLVPEEPDGDSFHIESEKEDNFELCENGRQQDALETDVSQVHLPPPARFLLCLVVCERLSYHSATVALPRYGEVVFRFSSKSAEVVATAFVAFIFLCSMFGGYLSDSRLGRFATLTYSAIFSMAGVFCWFLSALPFSWHDYPDDPTPGFAIPGFLIGLTLSGIGVGGLKSSLAPFFGDQIGTASVPLYGPAYRWYYWVQSIGAFTGTLFGPILNKLDIAPEEASQNSSQKYWTSFLLPSCTYLASAALFFVIKWRFVVHQPKRGLVTAINSMLSFERKAAASEEGSPDGPKVWLRHALASEEHKHTARDLRGFKNIVVYLALTYPFYWMGKSSVMSVIDAQAELMTRPSWMEVKHLQCVPPLILIVLIPLLEWNLFRRLIERKLALHPQTRIPVGFLFLAVSAVYIAALQLVLNSKGTWSGDVFTPSQDLSVWWQLPAFPFIALSELLAIAGGLEFIFVEAPASMLSFANGMFMLMTSLGAVLHLILILNVPTQYMPIPLFIEVALIAAVSLIVKYTKDQPVSPDVELSTAALIDDEIDEGNLSLDLAQAE